MSDLISRQAAIDAIDDIGSVDTYADRVYAKGIMRMLPSVQPNLQPTCNSIATDTISRQAAIDIVRKLSVKEVTPAYMLIDKTDAMTELMLLPSAQPEPEGDWVLVIRCKYCIVNPICRFKAALGDEGYCSQGDREADK